MLNTPMIKWLWLAVLALVLDQASKLIIANTMQLYQSIPLIPFFKLTYVHNTGAAFSFLSQAGGWQRWFFAILAIVVSIIITIWLSRLKEHENLLAASLSLILGGAIGNLIDRLAYGYVIDFLDVYHDTWHWPAFNIADSAITLGVFLMLLESFGVGKSEPTED
ncbi:signal peptidase II [Patescibacteria group bacterium]|nr:signal peptidase II [Patescibacteria group bacterium]